MLYLVCLHCTKNQGVTATRCGFTGGYVLDYFLAGSSNFLESMLVVHETTSSCFYTLLFVQIIKKRYNLLICELYFGQSQATCFPFF